MDSFVEDLCNTHDQGARCPESQAENSRQVQEFNFEIRSFLRKGLNRGTGSGTALVNDKWENWSKFQRT